MSFAFNLTIPTAKFSAIVDPATGKKKFGKSAANSLSMFLTVLLLLSRILSLSLIYLKKHVVPAVAILAVPSVISVCCKERFFREEKQPVYII